MPQHTDNTRRRQYPIISLCIVSVCSRARVCVCLVAVVVLVINCISVVASLSVHTSGSPIRDYQVGRPDES